MSRFSVTARIATLTATGAVYIAVATGAVANAQPAHLSARSAGCPATSKVSKAAAVQLSKPKAAKSTSKGQVVITCSYLNTSSGVLVVVEPKLSGSVTPADFSSEMKAAAKPYKSTVRKISRAGKAAAYFDMHRKMLGHEDYFGAVDTKKHLIGLGDNQAPKHMIRLARALG